MHSSHATDTANTVDALYGLSRYIFIKKIDSELLMIQAGFDELKDSPYIRGYDLNRFPFFFLKTC